MDYKEGDLLAYEQSIQRDPDRKTTEKLGRNAKSTKIQKRGTSDKKCTSCGTTSTPVWRWGGEAKEVLLCNACSLRIRRSATRPQRARSPTDVSSQKQSPVLGSGESSPSSNRILGELGPADTEALRLDLLRCVEFHLGLEKDRLLGPREAAAAEEEWANAQRASLVGGCMPHSPMQQLARDLHTPGPGFLQHVHAMPDPLHLENGLVYAGNAHRLRMM